MPMVLMPFYCMTIIYLLFQHVMGITYEYNLFVIIMTMVKDSTKVNGPV